MIKPELLKSFPTKRLKPVDGLAVTAGVWEESHDFHRQQQRFHALFAHGAGIVTGLDVIASDPADTSVYILPGMAVDSAGQSVYLAEPITYDVGTRMDGLLYIVLIHGESAPIAGERRDGNEEAPLYVHTEFVLQATPNVPDTPYVELARVKRVGRDSTLKDAKDPYHPSVNEIDLRFRRRAGAASQEIVGLGVAYPKGKPVGAHGRGASLLARALTAASHGVYHTSVDDNIPLDASLASYTLVYFVAGGAFQLSPDETNALFTILQNGGTLLMEACRKESGANVMAAEAAFVALAAALGATLEDVKAGHALLGEPHLFATLPNGYETEGTAGVKASGGLILSSRDYGCVWQGERKSGPASREDIRAAHEFGENLIGYALERKRKASQ